MRPKRMGMGGTWRKREREKEPTEKEAWVIWKIIYKYHIEAGFTSALFLVYACDVFLRNDQMFDVLCLEGI